MSAACSVIYGVIAVVLNRKSHVLQTLIRLYVDEPVKVVVTVLDQAKVTVDLCNVACNIVLVATACQRLSAVSNLNTQGSLQ